jgi:hypothetical protein
MKKECNMLERQLTGPSSVGFVPTSSLGTHLVTVESVDGTVVQLRAEGTDTVAEIRHIALGQVLGSGSASVDSAYTVLAGGAVIDPATTVDQLLSQDLQLELNLIKPGAWGLEPVHA